MFDFWTNKWSPIFLLVATLVFPCCTKRQSKTEIRTVEVSIDSTLAKLELPFPKISTLNEPIYFFETRNGMVISNFTKGQLSLFKTKEIGSGNLKPELLFYADLDSMNLAFCAMVTEHDGIAFGAQSSFFYHVTLNNALLSFKKVKLPKRFDALLADSIQLTIDRSVDVKPFLSNNEIIFSVYQIHTKQPNSIRNAFEAIYRAPLFLSYSLTTKQHAEINLTLDKLGFEYDSIHMDDFARIETRIGLNCIDNEHFLVCSEKREQVWMCNKKGNVENIYTYTYAKNEPDFQLTTVETGKGPHYITASAFYSNQWYVSSSQKFIRQLKRSINDENQIGQYETPWQLLVFNHEEDGFRLESVLNFEPSHFNYGDVHLVGNRYLLVSNSGINNKNYDPENHSYSILDLAEYLE